MRAIWQAMRDLLRGPRASRVLRILGIDARQFWLLVDLFDELGEREEILDRLGTNGVALKLLARVYCVLSVFISLLLIVAQPPVAGDSMVFLLLNAFVLLPVLLPETANSLVNPVEGLVLAHQPINGATYTAAKLARLGRIVLYLVTGLDVVPALAGATLKGSGWPYPFFHLGAAFAVGVLDALLCCALFGWLIRFMPPRRLKAAAQLAGALPFLSMMLPQLVRPLARADIRNWLPAGPVFRWGLAVALAAVAGGGVVFGIRALSADYLIRVSGMMRGGSTAGSKTRRSWIAGIVARCFGGKAARAGYAFVSRMMLRDWRFRLALLGGGRPETADRPASDVRERLAYGSVLGPIHPYVSFTSLIGDSAVSHLHGSSLRERLQGRMDFSARAVPRIRRIRSRRFCAPVDRSDRDSPSDSVHTSCMAMGDLACRALHRL